MAHRPSLRLVFAPERPWVHRVLWGGLTALLVVACWRYALDATRAAQGTALRLWMLLAGGGVVVALPNLRWPERNLTLLQLVNPPQRALLLTHVASSMLPLLGLTVLPALALSLAGEAMALLPFLQVLLVLLGTMAYTVARYVQLGPRAQAWHDGRAGQRYRAVKEETGQGLDLPPGLIPALGATFQCYGVLLLATVATALTANTWGNGWGLVPGLVLTAGVAWRFRTLAPAYDRWFYATQAFFSEVLTTGLVQGERRSLAYRATYWVPARWRPATWASLLQLDRKLPLGRLVAVGHMGLWLLVYTGVSQPVRVVYTALLVLGSVAPSALLADARLAPPAFQHIMQSVPDWIVTRLFVNLRWLLPHVLSVALVAWASDRVGMAAIGQVALLHAGAALVCAVATTLLHEYNHRRQLA